LKYDKNHSDLASYIFLTSPTHFKKLKDFLMNLKKDEWSYKWLDDSRNDDTSPFFPLGRLSS
jgi:hypothetical protein